MTISFKDASAIALKNVRDPAFIAEAKENHKRDLLDLPPVRTKHYSMPARKRTGQKVRRHSRPKGREGIFWRPMRRQEARQIVLAARRYEIGTKEKGKRQGALGHVAIEILDYLTNLMDYRTGRLEPALETMMKKLHRSKDAIVRALKALRQHGFIDWLRRYVPTDNDGWGVQVQQTSNAYRLFMPKRALRMLGRYGKKSPLPDDVTHALAEQAAQLEIWRGEMSLPELARFDVEDEKLAASLAKLGALIEKKRESAKQSESLSQRFFIGKKDRLSPDTD